MILEMGDELNAGLTDFAKERKLADASFTAIETMESVKLAW